MKLNPPPRVRAILYLIATFGTPVTMWAEAEHYLDKPSTVLAGSVLAIIMAIAVGNTVAQRSAKTTATALNEQRAELVSLAGKVTAVHETVLRATSAGARAGTRRATPPEPKG